VIGTVERYLDEAGARSAIAVLLAEINSDKVRMGSRSITVAQLCDHFEQRELARDNTWRSYSTKKTYQAYLTRWVLPHWRHYELAEVRTIQVESWLRRLPLAKSSCAKIRNLMSVLFNHACRYQLFDRNPIYLVRQSAKRRRAPTVLMPPEIKALVDSLGIRERTLVLLAVSTGLRQSELFGLKWGDIDLVQYTGPKWRHDPKMLLVGAKHRVLGGSSATRKRASRKLVGLVTTSQLSVTDDC
jgi:integrase